MIDYEEDWVCKVLCQCRKGSVSFRAALFAIPSGCIAVMLVVFADEWEEFVESFGVEDLSASQGWTVCTGVYATLLSFRTTQALSRFWEGTSLLHQMRGEWFDSVSCCVTFNMGALPTRWNEVLVFRHTIVRLMSLCHGSALSEIARGGTEDKIVFLDLDGLDTRTVMHLKVCKMKYGFNRVECLLHLLQTLITKAHSDGVLTIPAPILSRVYQTLSRGFVNLLNCKKITDTQFPFPYAQLIDLLLLLHVVLTPVMLSSVCQGILGALFLTLVVVYASVSLNVVAIVLENPFGNDPNDLPLAHFQQEMNNSLLMLLHANTDHVSSVRDGCCIKDFSTLMEHRRLAGRPSNFSTCFTEASSRSESNCDDEDDESTVLGEGPHQQTIPAMTPPTTLEEIQELKPKMALLNKSFEQFAQSLPTWARTIEMQVQELAHNFSALHVLGNYGKDGEGSKGLPRSPMASVRSTLI